MEREGGGGCNFSFVALARSEWVSGWVGGWGRGGGPSWGGMGRLGPCPFITTTPKHSQSPTPQSSWGQIPLASCEARRTTNLTCFFRLDKWLPHSQKLRKKRNDDKFLRVGVDSCCLYGNLLTYIQLKYVGWAVLNKGPKWSCWKSSGRACVREGW